MANFNKPTTAPAPKRDTHTTKNHEGSTVHQLQPLEVLFSKVLASFFGESTFYESKNAESEYKELVKLVGQVSQADAEYVLKIAQLGRMHNMIQYPLMMLTACFNDDIFKGEHFADSTGKSKFRKYTPEIIKRAKDITEILSAQIAMYGFAPQEVKVRGARGRNSHVEYHRSKPLPSAMIKSLRASLEKMDAYQLSKALGENKQVDAVTVNKTVVTMADAIKLLRPVPKNRQMSKAYQDIIEGTLSFGAGKAQVQSALSEKATTSAEKKEKAENIAKSLDTSTVMAIVKNLVAMYQQGVFTTGKAGEEALKKVVDLLTDAKAVQQSRLLPFRFYSAYHEVNALGSSYQTKVIKEALIKALDLSIVNLDVIAGYNAIVIDRSGSMNCSVSAQSKVQASEIALILGAIAFKQGIGDVYVFGNSCRKMSDSDMSIHDPVMSLVEKMRHVSVGGGTDFKLAMDTVRMSKQKYDNLIILTDNDVYGYNNGKITFGERYGYGNYVGSADSQINTMIESKQIKKVWLNNLLGNNFSVINTEDYRKNLIPGFSEKFIQIINVYNGLGGTSDIRKVIDGMLPVERIQDRRQENNKQKKAPVETSVKEMSGKGCSTSKGVAKKVSKTSVTKKKPSTTNSKRK